MQFVGGSECDGTDGPFHGPVGSGASVLEVDHRCTIDVDGLAVVARTISVVQGFIAFLDLFLYLEYAFLAARGPFADTQA